MAFLWIGRHLNTPPAIREDLTKGTCLQLRSISKCKSEAEPHATPNMAESRRQQQQQGETDMMESEQAAAEKHEEDVHDYEREADTAATCMDLPASDD